MIKTISTPQSITIWPSKEFWYCNIIGWIAFILLDAGSVCLHNNDFYGQVPHSFLTTLLGILFGLGYRYLAYRYQLHQRHPLSLVIFAVIIAILAGNFFTLIDYAVIREYPLKDNLIGLISNPMNYNWFPFFISQWIGTSHLLLIWLLLFNFIQAERYSSQLISANWLIKITAFLSVYFFTEFFHVLVTIAYYNPEGFLFSAAFLIDGAYTLATGIILAAAVLLFRAQTQLFRSYLIPILPSVVFLIFCTSFFCMITFRLLPSMDSLWQGSLWDLPQNIASVFTNNGQLWLDKHQFIGTLHSRLQTQAIVILLVICFMFPRYYRDTSAQDQKFNIKIWLQFWLYNLCGWSMLGCYLYFSDLLSWQSVSHDFVRFMLMAFITSGILAGLLIRAIIRRYQLLDNSLAGFTIKILSLSLIMGLLISGGLWLVGYIIVFTSNNLNHIQNYELLVKSGDFFIPLIAATSAGCLMWIMIYEKSVSQRLKHNHQLKQLQLENNLKELQLNALAGKIDPHFIFNALNNIRALIREDTEKARESILMLSDILRTPLTASIGNKIPLLDELTLARNYVALCKIQLEDRLDYREKIDTTLFGALIPPMFLQILIENAIKHGISQLPDGGELILEIRASAQKLQCTLDNSGSLQTNSTQQGFGLGLTNIRERLHLLYGEDASFELNEHNEIVSAILILPLEYAQ